MVRLEPELLKQVLLTEVVAAAERVVECSLPTVLLAQVDLV